MRKKDITPSSGSSKKTLFNTNFPATIHTYTHIHIKVHTYTKPTLRCTVAKFTLTQVSEQQNYNCQCVQKEWEGLFNPVRWVIGSWSFESGARQVKKGKSVQMHISWLSVSSYPWRLTFAVNRANVDRENAVFSFLLWFIHHFR